MIDFLTQYGNNSRYFNFNQLCEKNDNKSPIELWGEMVNRIYNETTSIKIRERAFQKFADKIDKQQGLPLFTGVIDCDGSILTPVDIYYAQYVMKNGTPLIIWRVVEILRPIYFLLSEISEQGINLSDKKCSYITIPCYRDFFYFLLATKSSIKRRKRWLAIFNK